MSKQEFYTHQEAQTKLMELFSEGKGLLALKEDPKCPPDMKEKLEKLSSLHFETVVALMGQKAQEGGNHGKA